ncbi:glycoside hydrolase family 15 protein [Lapillicoccus jejuensis]|uniref:GH15 family glucan-1,4-alpha-glucosidase n=1 Tax=Lapillicoccus jejuensis TaxID=402171 RepID=A0A542DY19_9MICO|nr:glycoside hydrolase family 15 protein [Lapillicoccus jejuensis]TQJ07834.1 GH15 family glucan-1,4-alpha-glucosidase [Lapillicoccus jejuensis]
MTGLEPVRVVRDDGGEADISSYGVLGDGRTVALLARDGRVDWWPVPRLDSRPAFAALVDPGQGGFVALRPTDPDATSEMRYLDGTNQLVTTFATGSGRVSVLTSLDVGNAGRLPWTELAWRLEGQQGEVELELVVAPGTGLREWSAWADREATGDGPTLLHAGEVVLAVRTSWPVGHQPEDRLVRSRVTVVEGERRVAAVVASNGEPLYLTDLDAIASRIDLTTDRWRQWSRQVRWDGPDRDRVVRSALALKTVIVAETGAIAAAATTSLPERVGGPKNWDYRLAWIRDAAFTIDAMSVCGMQEEVHASVVWLLRAIRAHGPDVHVVYDLDGGLAPDTTEPPVPGYRGSRPVRVGNGATSQTQLGVYGDLFGTVADWVDDGHVLDLRSARELADLADRCADSWRHDDAGIWELQDERPYTSSKMNCWRALDAAARLADAGHLPDRAGRWRREAAAVADWVQEHCWSSVKQAYTFYAGSDDLDASVLLGARFGFDTGERMASTVRAVERELGAGPLVYRYSAVSAEEETFLACAYWLVEALALTGRLDDARDRLGRLGDLVPPTGLMSEMVDARTGQLVGNLPQALSHLAHINAAATVRDLGPTGKDVDPRRRKGCSG